jgi:hypothetical protein
VKSGIPYRPDFANISAWIPWLLTQFMENRFLLNIIKFIGRLFQAL